MEFRKCRGVKKRNIFCNNEYPLTTGYFEFSKRWGFLYSCKSCRLIATNQRNQENPERHRERGRRSYSNTKITSQKRSRRENLRRFGIDESTYDKILEAQKGVCAICGEQEKIRCSKGNVRRLAIDHCHKTQKETGSILVRGIVCHRCNVVVGFMENCSLGVDEYSSRLVNYIKKDRNR